MNYSVSHNEQLYFKLNPISTNPNLANSLQFRTLFLEGLKAITFGVCAKVSLKQSLIFISFHSPK